MGTMRSRPSSRLGRWNARWDWTDRVNVPLSGKELARLRVSVERGRPFGQEEWVKRTASELNLGHTVRPEGRPPKPRNEPRPCFLLNRPHQQRFASLRSWPLGQSIDVVVKLLGTINWQF